jgi:hypothetical protein
VPLDFPNTPTDGQIFNAAGVSWMWDGVKWTSVLSAGGPFLPLAGGTMTGPLYWTATGGTVPRSAQDRSAEVLYAEDYGVVPNAADNTAALQAFFAALQAFAVIGVRGVLPSGILRFTTPLVLNVKQFFALAGSGMAATQLLYTGADATVDLLHIVSCSNFSLDGFTVDSQTVMTAGAGLHLEMCGSCWLDQIKIGGQSGATHTGSDGNLHYNLWNGVWFDKTGIAALKVFELAAQNDACRVNGVVGSGAGNKADVFLGFGKIMCSRVGVHIGGAFGGFCIDDTSIIANWNNCVIDQALAAEANREIFLGDHAMFDTAGYVGTPTAPGPVNPGGGAVGDNIIVNDPGGGFLVIRGWAVSAGGSDIHIIAWAGVIRVDGCLIAYAHDDGIRIDTPTPYVIVTPGTNIHDVTGYGINQTVAMNPVLGAPAFTVTHAGNLSPTTKLQLNVETLGVSFAPQLVAAGTTQATAAPIVASLSRVTSVAAGSGVRLPVAGNGAKFDVINTQATALTVYPPVGWSIYGGAANASRTLAQGYRLSVIADVVGSQWMIDYTGPLVVP